MGRTDHRLERSARWPGAAVGQCFTRMGIYGRTGLFRDELAPITAGVSGIVDLREPRTNLGQGSGLRWRDTARHHRQHDAGDACSGCRFRLWRRSGAGLFSWCFQPDSVWNVTLGSARVEPDGRMQTAQLRYVFLTGVLLAGAGLHLAFGEPASAGAPRWPESESLYTLQPWVAGPLGVEGADTGTRQVTRSYRSPSGATAMLTLFARPDPKLYGAGAEVPFLGGGFSVEPPPPNLGLANQAGVNALIAQRGAERWLVLYAYGERRGLLGNGAMPWAL